MTGLFKRVGEYFTRVEWHPCHEQMIHYYRMSDSKHPLCNRAVPWRWSGPDQDASLVVPDDFCPWPFPERRLTARSVSGTVVIGEKEIGMQFTLPEEGIVISELEKSLVTQALERTAGNQTAAAKLLGLTRDQIRYRMVKFDLRTEDA